MLTPEGKIIGINTFVLRDSEGLNYAILETTVQKHLPALTSGNLPKPTPAPPTTHWVPVFGPLAGHMHHDPDDGLFKSVTSHVYEKNVAMSAWFCNPKQSPFDYGFQIRRNSTDPFLVFYVYSNGTWGLRKWKGSLYQTLAAGPAPSLDAGFNRCNRVSAAVAGDLGVFALNGNTLLATDGRSIIDLGQDTSEGVTRVMTGFFKSSQRHGGITKFAGFRIWLPSATATADGDGIPQIPREWMNEDLDAEAGRQAAESHPPHPLPEPTAQPTPTPRP